MPKKTNIWVAQTRTKSEPNAQIQRFGVLYIFGQKELWRDLEDHVQQREFGYYFDNSRGPARGITKKIVFWPSWSRRAIWANGCLP